VTAGSRSGASGELSYAAVGELAARYGLGDGRFAPLHAIDLVTDAAVAA
jgi:hypothetical protein